MNFLSFSKTGRIKRRCAPVFFSNLLPSAKWLVWVLALESVKAQASPEPVSVELFKELAPMLENHCA
ncbi:MAG: hypothetical protein WCK17_06585, partial [Verrucomicrobiota bacterium]